MNEGKLFAETASGLVEVVSVNAAELARLPYDLAEGVYVVGTGSTGAAAALGVCGKPAMSTRTYSLNKELRGLCPCSAMCLSTQSGCRVLKSSTLLPRKRS